MANEITVGAYFRVVNGSLRDEFSIGNQSVTQIASGGPTPGFFTLGTSEETIAFGELSTKGWCVIQNLDTTNFIRWGFSTGVYGGKLLPGEACVFRLNTTSLFMIADTAACKVLVKGYEA
jgi:hypothetical protein